jgi:hypothetical protein
MALIGAAMRLIAFLADFLSFSVPPIPIPEYSFFSALPG